MHHSLGFHLSCLTSGVTRSGESRAAFGAAIGSPRRSFLQCRMSALRVVLAGRSSSEGRLLSDCSILSLEGQEYLRRAAGAGILFAPARNQRALRKARRRNAALIGGAMPGLDGLINNLRACASNPTAWRLARQSVKLHLAIQHVDELTEFTRLLQASPPRLALEVGTAQGGRLLASLSRRDGRRDIDLAGPVTGRTSFRRRTYIDRPAGDEESRTDNSRCSRQLPRRKHIRSSRRAP